MATDIGRLYAIIGADTSQFDKKMKGIGNRLSKVGKKLTTRLTLPLIALAGAAVKAGADFEYSMTNAWAVTGEGEEALAAMTAKAREMGATTIFSAKQAGDAMYYMASAGWDSKKMAEAIKPTLDLAAATQSDLAFATEAVISSMNQFQITTKDTGRVTNVFAAAIMGSQATLEKLKISMTFIGPLANALGHEIEGTTAALMGLYNAGYEASTAGTALRMGLAKLTEGTGRTKEGLKALGLSTEDVNPEMYTMTEIIRKLEERSASATDVIKIFGVRSGPALAALIAQGSDALDEFEGKITDTNSAAEMAEKQIKTFKGSFKLLTSIINEACIQIFQVLGPIIKDLIDKKIRPAIEAFTKFSDKKKKLIMIIAGLVAAIGPMLMIFGTLIGSIIPALVSGVLGLGKALLFLALNPVGLVITAVALLAFLIIKNWAKVKEVTTKVFAYIGAFFKAVWATIGDTVMTVLNFIVNYYKKVGGFLLKIGGIIGKGLVGAWKWCFSKAKDIFEAIGKVVIGALLKLANAIAKIPLVKKFGKDLKEALEMTKKKLEESEEAMKKSREESDKLKESTEELEKAELKKGKALKLSREEVAKAVEAEKAAIESAEKWQERLKELGVETIPDMKKKMVTLSEEIGKLDEMFKTGEIGVTDYFNALKVLKDEIDELKSKIEETLPPARDLADVWEAMKPPTEKIDEAAISLETVGEVWNSVVKSMGESLMDWSNMTGNILKNVTKIFGTFIQETIKGIGKLVIAELLAAKKEILIAKTKAIAKAIAKVFAKLPFPINVIVAGTMFGVVGALFSKLLKLEKGGIVEKRTIAEVAEKEPEVVSPLGKLVEIIKKAIIPMIPAPQIIMPQITAMPAGAGFAPVSRFEQPVMRGRGGGGPGAESVRDISIKIEGPLVSTTGLARADMEKAGEEMLRIIKGQLRRGL